MFNEFEVKMAEEIRTMLAIQARSDEDRVDGVNKNSMADNDEAANDGDNPSRNTQPDHTYCSMPLDIESGTLYCCCFQCTNDFFNYITTLVFRFLNIIVYLDSVSQEILFLAYHYKSY